MIGAVIVAAGEGRRLGGAAKATLIVDEKGAARHPEFVDQRLSGGSSNIDQPPVVRPESFLARIVRVAREAQVGAIVIVTGEPHRTATEREARRLGLAVVVNPDPGRGMGSSVGVGFAAAETDLAGAAAALLWPVDHPFVTAATVRELCARATVGGIVIPTRGGRGGHPVLAGRAVWAELALAAELPEGARSVFLASAERVRRIEVVDDGVLADVDYPADLA